MKIKVCGLMRPEDARLSSELGAWACGLIFAPQSPRRLKLDQAKDLRAEISPGTLAVGVFQGNPREEILRAVEDCRLDAVQLYAKTAEEVVGFPVPVLWATEKAPASIPNHLLGLLIEPERAPEDRVLGRKLGAAAQEKAWRTAASLKKAGRFVVLAGGLDADNVARAAAEGKPDAVDVSSGVESKPGEKDPNKLRRFFAALR